jgi:hypothetical protein
MRGRAIKLRKGKHMASAASRVKNKKPVSETGVEPVTFRAELPPTIGIAGSNGRDRYTVALPIELHA